MARRTVQRHKQRQALVNRTGSRCPFHRRATPANATFPWASARRLVKLGAQGVASARPFLANARKDRFAEPFEGAIGIKACVTVIRNSCVAIFRPSTRGEGFARQPIYGFSDVLPNSGQLRLNRAVKRRLSRFKHRQSLLKFSNFLVDSSQFGLRLPTHQVI